MNGQLFITLYITALPLFIVGDLLWLSVIAKDFYQGRLGHLLGDVNWVAVIIFYVIFIAGLTYFATYPSATKNSLLAAALLGGLFGFFTYATYDLTNWATLRDWPALLTVVDIVWGALLCATVAAATVFINEHIL